MKTSSRSDNFIKSGRSKTRVVKSLKSQLKDVDLWRAAAAEFLASFIFLFIVCIVHMTPQSSLKKETLDSAATNKHQAYGGESLQVSVGVALTYATLIQCFENISGGHMNPAISVAMVIAGHITLLKAAIYSLAQITGAFSAVALCFGMIPNPISQATTISQVNTSLTPFQGFGIEVLQALILTVAWLATYVTSKTQLGSSALPVGMAYLANSLWAGQLTGSSTNPARSIPPAVLSQQWKDLWVYIAGPFVGCAVGAVLYTQVFVTTPGKHRRREVTSSGRSAEGESVQSDEEVTDTSPFKNTSQNIQTTNFSNPKRNSSVLTHVSHQRGDFQLNTCLPKQTTENPHSIYMQQNTTVSAAAPLSGQSRIPQLKNMLSPCEQQNVGVDLQSLRHPALNAQCPTNVILNRNNSQVVSRPSTACGALMTPNGRMNGSMDALSFARSQATTPSVTFRSISVTEPFIGSSRNLINNNVL